MLFANLPGTGVIELGKYGVAKSLDYRVVKDVKSMIEYTVEVRKNQQRGCSIQNREMSQGGKLVWLTTWQNIMLMQLTSDWSLRYFYCQLPSPVTCNYSLQMPFPHELEQAAYQLIDQT